MSNSNGMHSNVIGEVAQRLITIVERRKEVGGIEHLGLPTGFSTVDRYTGGLQRDQMWIVAARTGGGKALDINTPIPTPEGWTTMGELKVGDMVFDENGEPCRVTYVRPVKKDEIQYRVWFSDGTYLDACSEHRWLTHDWKCRKSEHNARQYGRDVPRPLKKYGVDQTHKRARPRIVTTQELKDTLTVGHDQRLNHAIPVAGPLDLPEQELPIPPYTFGVWLGDGKSTGAEIYTADSEVIDGIRAEGVEVGEAKAQAGGNKSYRYGIGRSTAGRGNWQNHDSLQKRLRGLGVLGNKHIPSIYLRGSIAQRLALLRGLVDSDGYVKSSGGCEITQKNARLAADIRELIVSLGMVCTTTTKTARIGAKEVGDVTIVRFTPTMEVATVVRKRERLKLDPSARRSYRYVTKVEPVERVDMTCITVDSPSHLYLAGRSMVPTHNTSFALDAALKVSRTEPSKSVLFYSLEMSAEVLVNRLISRMTDVAGGRIIRGMIDDNEMRQVRMAAEELGDLGLHIIDSTASAEGITDHAMTVADKEPVSLVVIDYLQLLTDRVGSSETERIGEISRRVRAIARPDYLDVPVIALSQLNRASQTSEDKLPALHHLKNSSNLEQDANVVLLLHRPALENQTKGAEPQDVENDAVIIIAKNREGFTGSTEAQFIPRLTKWRQ